MATPEQFALQNIRSLIEIYQSQSGGAPPESWKQMSEKVNLSGFKSITENYVFISKDKIPMLGFEEGMALLIRTSPMLNLATNLGRYVISRNQSGLKFNWYSEQKIQQMLAESGVKELPKPESVEMDNPSATTKEPAAKPIETSPVAIQGDPQPQITGQNAPNNSAPTTNASAPIPQTVATATPGSRPSWLGLVVVLGIGFLASIFLLFRTKQK